MEWENNKKPGKPGETESFDKLMGEYEKRIGDVEAGDIVNGRVIEQKEDYVYFDLGGRLDGRIDITRNSLPNTVQTGDSFELLVTGVREGFFECSLHTEGELLNAKTTLPGHFPKAEEVVKGKIKSVNSGGFEVNVEDYSCFAPFSLMDSGYGEDPDSHIGEVLEFSVKESDPENRKFILDRRDIISELKLEKKATLLNSLKTGDIYEGTVKAIKDYGLFVDLGGIEGLLHVSDISYEKIENVSEMFEINDEVKVMIKNIDRNTQKISLSAKEFSTDPWEEFIEKFSEGDKITGKVVTLKPYGAFIDIYRNITGLVHISKLGTGKFHSHPKEVLKPGEEKDFWIEKIDTTNRKIALTAESPGTDYSKELDKLKNDSANSEKNGSSGTLGDLLDKALGGK